MDTPDFTITENAAKRINALVANEPDSAFRVAVDGGGCSGFQYRFEIVQGEPAAEDVVFTRDGARVWVDDVSLQLLSGSQIDYVETLAGASFEISNPNSTAKCGCGNSFAISLS